MTIRDRIAETLEQHDATFISARLVGSLRQRVDHEESDIDVIFLFAQEPKSYVGFNGTLNNLQNHSDEIDVSGWNVEKFGKLLADSNPDAVEYFNSPSTGLPDAIDHSDVGDDAIENFNHMALYHHYLSLASSNYHKYVQSENKPTVNRNYHVANATARAQYIRRAGRLPPASTHELIDSGELLPETRGTLSNLADRKMIPDERHKRIGDFAGEIFRAEDGRDMEPTDARINSPDKDAINNFIHRAVDHAKVSESQIPD